MGKEDQRLGKKGEFRVFGELLSRNLTVYYPLFDVEGIDCIVRNEKGEHIDIQVKTRTDIKLWDVAGLTPRSDLYIVILVMKPEEQIWVIPSEVYMKLSRTHTAEGGKKVSRLIISSGNEEELQKYNGSFGFNKLVNFISATDKSRRSVTTTEIKPRISAQHYKQADFYPIILQTLEKSKAPLGRQEMIDRISEQLSDKFSDADKAILKGGRVRWRSTLRFAISHLAMEKQIVSKGRNQWQLPN